MCCMIVPPHDSTSLFMNAIYENIVYHLEILLFYIKITYFIVMVLELLGNTIIYGPCVSI